MSRSGMRILIYENPVLSLRHIFMRVTFENNNSNNVKVKKRENIQKIVRNRFQLFKTS